MATRTVLLLSMAAAAMGFQPMSGQSLALKSTTTSISRAGAYASLMRCAGHERRPTSLPGSPSRTKENAGTTAAGQLLVRTASTQSPGRKSLPWSVSDVFALPAGVSLRRPTRTAVMMVTPEEEAAFRAREDAEIAARRAKELEDERRYIQQSSGINYRKNEQDKFIFAAGKAPLSTQRACTSLPHPSASYNARSHEHDVTRIFSWFYFRRSCHHPHPPHHCRHRHWDRVCASRLPPVKEKRL